MKEGISANAMLKDLLKKYPFQEYNHYDNSCELVDQLFNINAEDYYCIKEGFCFQTSQGITIEGTDLSNFEWEGNEIFISEEETGQVVRAALAIVRQLAEQLLENYPGIAFDIFLSFDIEDSDLPPSATIRFYKVRGGNHIVASDEIDNYEQPVGIYQL